MDPSTALVRDYMAAWPGDFDRLSQLRSETFLEDWPQSGERIRGDANYRAIHTNYPGGMPSHQTERITGAERASPAGGAWALSPSFTLVHLSGGAEGTYTVEGLLDYPDGRRFHLVAVLTIADGRVAAQRTYFAEPFAAPEWRSQWVERVEGNDDE